MPTHLSGLLQSSLIFQMKIESENHSKQQHANSVFQVSAAWFGDADWIRENHDNLNYMHVHE